MMYTAGIVAVSIYLLVSQKTVTAHSRNMGRGVYCPTGPVPKDLNLNFPGGLMAVGPDTADSSRLLIVTRSDGTKLKDGDKYVLGEELVLSLDPSPEFVYNSYEAAFQTTAGAMTGAPVYSSGTQTSGIGCPTDGVAGTEKRAFMFNPTLVIPMNTTQDIAITAGWHMSTNGARAAVKIPPKITLVSATAAAGGDPPSTGGGAQVTKEKKVDLVSHYLAVGLVYGFIGLILVGGLFIMNYFRTSVQDSMDKFNLGVSYTALILVTLSAALVAAWAKINVNGEFQYLGMPDWKTNVLTWHIVLIVAGFFFSQVLAILSWSLFPHNVGKSVHVFWQTAALATLIASIIATVKSKQDLVEDHLVSMHSWMGVATVLVFCANYVFGLVMGIITAAKACVQFRSTYDLRVIHRAFGTTSLGLTVIAILTGIMSYTGRFGCSLIDTQDQMASYPNLPDGCKIANGMGIAVVSTAILTVLLISTRKHEVREINEKPPSSFDNVIEVKVSNENKDESNKDESKA
mmetsp:Transcript_13709/g.13254  ORF Transcript_13709/g.13254 Transcript_13709/m.13254 type:complete len:516 (+) Transcript_13709:291-1838(+)